MAERGRPTVKSPERVAKILSLAKEGKTDNEIAKIVGVGSRTIRTWKVQDWEFSAALKESKDLADDLVEASLFQNATGFYYDEDATTKESVVRIEKFQPPIPTAQIFWLKNRRANIWRDRREEDHKVIMVKQETAATLTLDQAIEEYQRLLKKLEDERDTKVIDAKIE